MPLPSADDSQKPALLSDIDTAADQIADAVIGSFWERFTSRMNAAGQEISVRINPEVKLRSLVVQIFQQSVATGWVSIDSYAYQVFVHCDLLSIPEVLEFVAETAAERGILTTRDIELANELYRQIRTGQWNQSSRHWWQIF